MDDLILDQPRTRLEAALSGRYRIERELGSGGMATVFLAEDLRQHRRVAIKVLKEVIASAATSARFLREIEIASRLTHPHLLPLHESGEAAGLLYYVMPYVEGESLRDRIRREKQLSVDEAVRIASEVAEALSYAHRNGVIHRDIKPENILLQDGRALLADFGVAHAVTSAVGSAITSSGVVLGTAMYMSPEQAFGSRDVDARSDVYALGCVVYEMLAGEPPFTGPTSQAIIARHAAERIPSLRVVRPSVPEELEAVVTKALAKTPADRFDSAELFAQRLSACTGSAGTRRRLPRRRGAVIAGGLALATAALLLVWPRLSQRPLHDQDWVLVADFDGPADDPRLGDDVRDLATQAFAQSRFVRIFDRRQLNDVMRRAGIPETTHVTPERARELAVRSSVRAMLRGGVRRMEPNGFEIVLHVLRADDGSSLASAAGTATRATLPDTMQALVRTLRERLGEQPSVIAANRPLRDVATPVFEAFRKYTIAMDDVLMRGNYVGSNKLLTEAIALDTGFAPAWALMGTNYTTLRQFDSSRVAFSHALALPNRLSVAETYRLKGDVAYTFDHDVPAAIKWYDLYLAELPYSRSGRSNRALYLSALGAYEKALDDAREAVAINPFGAGLIQPIQLNLAAVEVVLGHTNEARLASDSLIGPFAAFMQIMIAGAESRWGAAESASTVALRDSAAVGVFRINAMTSLASAAAARGAVHEADSVLATAANSSRGSAARWYERARLLLAVASGAPVKPRTDIVVRDTTTAAEMLRALWSAVAGDTNAARAALPALNALPTQQRTIVGAGPTLISAWIAAHGGRWREVTDLVGGPALVGEHDPTILDRPDSFFLRWLAATAYERLGRLDSAATYLSLILRPTRLPPVHFSLRGLSFGFAHDRLADVERRRRHSEVAAAHLDTLLLSFTKADWVTRPMVVRAIARRNEIRAAR